MAARFFPDFPDIDARLGWTMFRSIDRVYHDSRIERDLGFRCRTGFGEALRRLQREP